MIFLYFFLYLQEYSSLLVISPFSIFTVIGATQWPLFRLDLYGSLRADGQSHSQKIKNRDGTLIGGLGGGSGGTILLFLQKLALAEKSSLSAAGGKGGPLGGGGGGGGRIHFHWSNINTGDEYIPIAVVNGTIYSGYV